MNDLKKKEFFINVMKTEVAQELQALKCRMPRLMIETYFCYIIGLSKCPPYEISLVNYYKCENGINTPANEFILSMRFQGRLAEHAPSQVLLYASVVFHNKYDEQGRDSTFNMDGIKNYLSFTNKDLNLDHPETVHVPISYTTVAQMLNGYFRYPALTADDMNNVTKEPIKLETSKPESDTPDAIKTLELVLDFMKSIYQKG
jgi:hypothetical protein